MATDAPTTDRVGDEHGARCAECGYVLLGTRGTCPECGTSLAVLAAPPSASRLIVDFVAGPLLAAAFLVAAVGVGAWVRQPTVSWVGCAVTGAALLVFAIRQQRWRTTRLPACVPRQRRRTTTYRSLTIAMMLWTLVVVFAGLVATGTALAAVASPLLG